MAALFVAFPGLSLAVASGGYSWLWCTALSLQWLLLLGSTGWGVRRLFTTVAQRLNSAGPGAVARGLTCPMACGIFPDQESNYVPCIGRWICIHCATKEVLERNLNLRSQGSVCTLNPGRGSHQPSCASGKPFWSCSYWVRKMYKPSLPASASSLGLPPRSRISRGPFCSTLSRCFTLPCKILRTLLPF